MHYESYFGITGELLIFVYQSIGIKSVLVIFCLKVSVSVSVAKSGIGTSLLASYTAIIKL